MPESRRRVAILTRRREDNVALAERLRASGMEVIELPCVRTEQLADVTELATAIRALAPEDWLVVTSRAGADAVARAARPGVRVAAIGRVTAARLETHGIAVAYLPPTPSGTVLARGLPLARVALLARSDRALPDLPEILRARGFEVREVMAYRTDPRADGDLEPVRAALADRSRDVRVFVASPSAVEAFAVATGVLAANATFHVAGSATESFARMRVPLARIQRAEEGFDVIDR
jgi:uroporphyrinogen-III synthase